MTFAQDEESAQHPSMPRAAALDGNVDHVLRPQEIARRLLQIGRHAYAKSDDSRVDNPPPTPATAADPVGDIIRLLLARTAVDFTNYKQTRIRRRILRRMALVNVQDPRVPDPAA